MGFVTERNRIVPRYLFNKIKGRGGQRLPKLIFLGEEIEDTSLAALAHSTVIPDYPMGFRGRESHRKEGPYSEVTKMVLSHPVLEFKHWEYRFWSVEVIDATRITQAICRICQKSMMTPEGRKNHAKEGCFSTMAKASRLMEADHHCVICSHRTSNNRWGFHICGDQCEQVFLHEIDQPEPLYSMLQRIEKGEFSGIQG